MGVLLQPAQQWRCVRHVLGRMEGAGRPQLAGGVGVEERLGLVGGGVAPGEEGWRAQEKQGSCSLVLG